MKTNETRPTVIIPRSKLGTELAQVGEIKQEMTRLLKELERGATGHDTGKPGGWRRDPLVWDRRHFPGR